MSFLAAALEHSSAAAEGDSCPRSLLVPEDTQVDSMVAVVALDSTDKIPDVGIL